MRTSRQADTSALIRHSPCWAECSPPSSALAAHVQARQWRLWHSTAGAKPGSHVLLASIQINGTRYKNAAVEQGSAEQGRAEAKGWPRVHIHWQASPPSLCSASPQLKGALLEARWQPADNSAAHSGWRHCRQHCRQPAGSHTCKPHAAGHPSHVQDLRAPHPLRESRGGGGSRGAGERGEVSRGKARQAAVCGGRACQEGACAESHGWYPSLRTAHLTPPGLLPTWIAVCSRAAALFSSVVPRP